MLGRHLSVITMWILSFAFAAVSVAAGPLRVAVTGDSVEASDRVAMMHICDEGLLFTNGHRGFWYLPFPDLNTYTDALSRNERRAESND